MDRVFVTGLLEDNAEGCKELADEMLKYLRGDRGAEVAGIITAVLSLTQAVRILAYTQLLQESAEKGETE